VGVSVVLGRIWNAHGAEHSVGNAALMVVPDQATAALRFPAQVELAAAEWTDWYNHTRLHGEIGHIPPAEYEANRYRNTTKPQVTTNI
jgi:transposase InsO family protein